MVLGGRHGKGSASEKVEREAQHNFEMNLLGSEGLKLFL